MPWNKVLLVLLVIWVFSLLWSLLFKKKKEKKFFEEYSDEVVQLPVPPIRKEDFPNVGWIKAKAIKRNEKNFFMYDEWLRCPVCRVEFQRTPPVDIVGFSQEQRMKFCPDHDNRLYFIKKEDKVARAKEWLSKISAEGELKRNEKP